MIRYGGNLPRLLYPSQAVARSNVTDETLADARAILAGRTAAGGGPVPAMLTPGPKRLFPGHPPLATKPLDPDPAPTVNGAKVTAPSGGDPLAGGSGGDAMGSGGPEAGGGLWDWLKADAYGADDNPLAAAVLGKEGMPGRASRLDALGDTLLGAARGYQQGLMSGVKGAGIGGAFIGAAEGLDASKAQDQAMLRQQVADMIALKKASNTDTSEFERLLAGKTPEEKAKLTDARLGTLANETQQVTYRQPTPEEAAQGIVAVGSNGKPEFAPGDYHTSETERASIDAQRASAAATENLARATLGATQAQRDIENQNRNQDDVNGLRKEFDDLPEVRNYKTQLPIIKSMIGSLDKEGSDLDFIYGTAKIIDPAGAVQQGDADTIRNSSTLNSLLGGYLNVVQGGGKLGPERRRQILDLALQRVKNSHDLYSGAVERYSSYAKDDYGVDPRKVVRDLGAPPELPPPPDAGPKIYGAVPEAAPEAAKVPPPMLMLNPAQRAKAQQRVSPAPVDPNKAFFDSVWNGQ